MDAAKVGVTSWIACSCRCSSPRSAGASSLLAIGTKEKSAPSSSGLAQRANLRSDVIGLTRARQWRGASWVSNRGKRIQGRLTRPRTVAGLRGRQLGATLSVSSPPSFARGPGPPGDRRGRGIYLGMQSRELHARCARSERSVDHELTAGCTKAESCLPLRIATRNFRSGRASSRSTSRPRHALLGDEGEVAPAVLTAIVVV
jgi:hypothetical protein